MSPQTLRVGPSLAEIGMVQSIEIDNFRGFERLKVDDLALINIIVGDNAVGKTAFLEAFFLAVSGSAQKPLSLKQWRGMNSAFQTGMADSVVEGIYADLFHDPSSPDPITISLVGRGFENRKLVILKTPNVSHVPAKSADTNRHARRAAKSKGGTQIAQLSEATTAPISLVWTDQHGNEHQARVLLASSGLTFEGTGENLPNCFMYAAQIPVPPEEAASNYSSLRRRRETEPFRRAFLSVFDQITDISTETEAGTSVLVADVPWAKRLLPLAVLSGGTNRAAAILLSIANRRDGLVLVDECESGIYHARQGRFAKALVNLSREYQTQILMTTHSEEWIKNFMMQISPKDDDVVFWRMERTGDNKPHMRLFGVEEFANGLALGEMR